MVNFGPLTAETGWRVRVLALLPGTAATSLNGSQPNFARCLAVCWAGILYIHFLGLLPHNRILPSAKFTLHPSLAFSCFGNVTARHWSSGRQPNFAAWYKEWNYGTFAHHFQQGATYFPRAAITLGIGPHSSFTLVCCVFYLWCAFVESK